MEKIMVNRVQADYREFSIPTFQGNPLISAIRKATPLEYFTKKLSYQPEFQEGLDDFERELQVELIDSTYIVPLELHALYKTIVKNIIIGYIHRNPVSRDMKHEQHLASVQEDYHFPVEKNLSKCTSILGHSGTGKTLSIRSCFSFLPQVIEHSKYQDEQVKFDQIVYIEFQAPVTKTTRGFVLSFFLAIDSVIDTFYYEEWKGKSTSVPLLIQEAKKVALNHHVGIAFIDEIQRCAYSKDKAEKADFATLEFIDDFFNSVGIPMIVAGTFKAKPLFDVTMSTTRRLSSARSFKYLCIPNDLFLLENGELSFWSIFIDKLYYPELLEGDFSFDIAFKEKVYELTIGLPALTIRLFRLAYEHAIDTGIESLSVELLEEVFRLEFELLQPAIKALRDGESGGYEDLLPSGAFKTKEEFLIGEVIDKAIKEDEKQQSGEDDDGLVVEFEAVTQDVIPTIDLRNLSSLSTDELTDILGDK